MTTIFYTVNGRLRYISPKRLQSAYTADYITAYKPLASGSPLTSRLHVAKKRRRK